MAVVSLSDPVTPTSSTFFLGHPMHVFPTLRDLSIYSMRPTTSSSFLVAPIHCLANDVHLSNRFHHDARSMLLMFVFVFLSATELVSL